jgi:hypothetical protein
MLPAIQDLLKEAGEQHGIVVHAVQQNRPNELNADL